MIVGIDFCKFLRVAHVNSLSLVPKNCGGGGRRRCGFSESSWYGYLKLLVAPRFTLELGLTRGELRGGSSDEWWPGRGMAAAREEGRSLQGFRDLRSLPHKHISDDLTRRRCFASGLS